MEIIRLDKNNLRILLSDLIVTIGMFDGVHIGHRAIIEKLVSVSEEKNAIPTVITFDCHPRIVLQQDIDSIKLLSSQKEKFTLLKSLGVEKVLVIPFTKSFSCLSASEFVKEYLIGLLKIKGLILGYDNHFGNKNNNDFENIFRSAEGHFFIEKIGASILNGITVSSTQIRRALKTGNIRLANDMLGYEYNFEGKVVSGEKIGRTLGFPTANISLVEKLKMLPENGVYAVKINYNDKLFSGMLNIGIRPTIGDNQQSIEVNIFDFNEDIYGEDVIIYLLSRIREEIKFTTLNQLKEQLVNDEESVKAILKKHS